MKFQQRPTALPTYLLLCFYVLLLRQPVYSLAVNGSSQSSSSSQSSLSPSASSLPSSALDPTTIENHHQSKRGLNKAISTNKNGGHIRTFYFDTATTAEQLSLPATQKALASPIFNKNNNNQENGLAAFINRVKSGIRSTFLPAGYPLTTPPGYLRYCAWSWTQELSTQMRSVLATQRVLQGVGVGNAEATALSAILQFLIRDGCGMAASLLFTSVAASKFKRDIKRWRILADVMIDVGITLELAATQCPPYLFLPMISVGSMCRAICGVAAGASGGAINLHWAQGSDISDVQAKFGAQNTITGSLGLIFAAFFARSLADVNALYLWTLYGGLTALHIYANTQCMKLIAFDTPNNLRMDMLLSKYFHDPTQSLPDPHHVSRHEPLLFLPTKSNLHSIPIHFGVPFDTFIKQAHRINSNLESEIDPEALYWISPGLSNSGELCVLVALSNKADPTAHAKAYFEAVMLGRHLRKHNRHKVDAAKHILDGEQSPLLDLETQWNDFASKCTQAGWKLEGTELNSHGYSVLLQ